MKLRSKRVSTKLRRKLCASRDDYHRSDSSVWPMGGTGQDREMVHASSHVQGAQAIQYPVSVLAVVVLAILCSTPLERGKLMADGITIDVLGNKAILDNLDKFGVTMQLKAQMLLEEAGDMAKEKADDLAPVGSREYESDGESHPGYLKSQNYVEKQQGVVTVGNDAHYAAPVELGHHTRSGSFVPPQPFLVPSWIDAGDWLKSKLSGLVK